MCNEKPSVKRKTSAMTSFSESNKDFIDHVSLGIAGIVDEHSLRSTISQLETAHMMRELHILLALELNTRTANLDSKAI